MSDAHGSTVYYVYDQRGVQSYLTDVYYVSPADCASTEPSIARQCTSPFSAYGAQVRLVHEARTDELELRSIYVDVYTDRTGLTSVRSETSGE
jgi:hypothetical protein